jgi:hypothetical protein
MVCEERIPINNGFNAMAMVVIPAATFFSAMIKMPKYKAVLNAPKTVTCHHSIPLGRE